MKPIHIAFAALFVLAGPFAAFAHAKLTSSVPKDGSTVPSGLTQIELKFSDPLRITVVHVSDDAQHEVAIKGELPKSFAPTVKLILDPLTSWAYKVSWTGVADDGHVLKGGIGFTVKASEQPTK